ncbi:MAG: hotdog fold thioesterase [Cytophagaceae bacterium]|jgi:1,4-dihydroxy-2-naphthoyl-CoA hydrolase|nr:hotdog fold thioesterase [Cytophagaceae bacterium]
MRKPETHTDFNELSRESMIEHLGITLIEVQPKRLIGSMPVDYRTKQPYGLLHGGASVVLAETLGSYGSVLHIDTTKQYCVGMAIQSQHFRPVSEGHVIGTAELLHKGKKTHVWEISIHTEEGKLVNKSSLTVMIVDKNPS